MNERLCKPLFLTAALSLSASLAHAEPRGRHHASQAPKRQEPETASPEPEEAESDSSPSAASDEGAWGGSSDDAAGFATPSSRERAAVEGPKSEPSPFSLTGFARSQWGLWLERLHDNPFAKGRQNLDLQLRYSSEHWRAVAAGHAEYDVAYRVQRETYDAATLDAYEHLVDVRESYLTMTYDPAEFTFGRLIVPWGQGDVVSVLDRINPRDLREPGLADLDDLRLPVLATRFGFFFGYHRIEALLVHESWYGYRPPPLGEFSPVRALIQNQPVDVMPLLRNTVVRYDDRDAGFVFDKQQYALAWSFKGPEMDASIYVASLVDQFGIFAGLNPANLTPPLPSKIDVIVDHPRYTLAGYSGAVPAGDFLFKWEFAVTPNRTYNLQPPTNGALDFLTNPAKYTSRATFAGAMVGVTYSGLPNTLLFFEGGQTTALDGASETLFGGSAPIFALRSLHTLFNENLLANLTFYGVGWSLEYGYLARAELTYRLSDDVKLGLGAITYHPGKELGLLSGLDRHDRLFTSFRWDFQAF